MYSGILKGLVDARKFDDAYDMWICMHEEGVNIEEEAFNVMLIQCARTAQVNSVLTQY